MENRLGAFQKVLAAGAAAAALLSLGACGGGGGAEIFRQSRDGTVFAQILRRKAGLAR